MPRIKATARPLTYLFSSIFLHISHYIEDAVSDVNWIHVAFKICAFAYIGFFAWLAWHILPLPGHWSVTHRRPDIETDLTSYFDTFDGARECTIGIHDLYAGPPRDIHGMFPADSFCPTRATLLQSMSEGGRVGWDAPYGPRACHYAWFTTPSICTILERFDSVIFIGDHSLQPIYGGFNILLRRDLLHGALQTWSLAPQALAECRCQNQFMSESCLEKTITSSEELMSANNKMMQEEDGSNSIAQQQHHQHRHRPQNTCSHVPHAFLKISATTGLSRETTKKFQQLAPKRPASSFKHIPIIFSLSAHSSSVDSAKTTLKSLVRLADDTGRKTDILYLGPTAPGHVDMKGRKGNQEIWDFHHTLSGVARDNDVDVLGLWNMTVQAASWDGVRFGEGVAITQAMMVINWLGRLETS